MIFGLTQAQADGLAALIAELGENAVQEYWQVGARSVIARWCSGGWGGDLWYTATDGKPCFTHAYGDPDRAILACIAVQQDTRRFADAATKLLLRKERP